MTFLQTIVLVPLLTIGMTWPIWMLYRWLREDIMNKKIDKDGKVGVIAIVAFFCAIFNFAVFVPRIVVGDIVNEVTKAQSQNCANTYTEDGKELTDNQCSYFKNVLDGYFLDYTPDFDIKSYINH